MKTVCDPIPFSRVTVTLERQNGTFEVGVFHYHEGDRGPCVAAQDHYTKLQWDEACDVVAAALDTYRPGVSPAGWEQLQLRC